MKKAVILRKEKKKITEEADENAASRRSVEDARENE